MNMNNQIDSITKSIFIGLIILVSYFLFFTIFQLLLMSPPRNMIEMMEHMTGFNQQYFTLNIISLILAVVIGLLISLKLKVKPLKNSNELQILKKALSNDENKVIEMLKKGGKITQDSLRFRLEWSKAKVSRILTQLDKMSLIQRERVGKTYYVFLQKSL